MAGKIRAAVWLNMKYLPGADETLLRATAAALPEADFVRCETADDFVAALPEARVAVVWGFDRAWLDRAPKLEWIATPSAGHDWVNLEHDARAVVTYGGFHGELMAETVVGMMLLFARGLHESFVRHGEAWPREEVTAVMRPFRGSRVTVVGFGKIGKWVGRLAMPFGVRLTGVNRTDLERPAYFDAGDRVVSLDGLDAALSETDHLVLALPGTTGAENLIDRRRLALLPRGAFVHNVGRGNVIDETALADALDRGRVAGAGLDVFAVEPLPLDSPLRRCRNALLMPHSSAFAPNYMGLFFEEFKAHWHARFG